MRHSFSFPAAVVFVSLVFGIAPGPGKAGAMVSSTERGQSNRSQIEESIRQAEEALYASDNESAYDAERAKFGILSLMRHES